jgi:SAM-dependent methyltransferase
VVLAASLGDTVEAVSLFCVAGRTAEYHLNASSIRGRELTAQLIAGAITRLASASVGLLTRRQGASRRWALPIQAEVQRNAQAGASRVLDLGCGTGTIAIALAGDVTGRVVGVAAPAGMLQVAKEKSESFEWVRGTCDYPRGRAGRPRRMLLRHPSVPAARRRSAAGVRRRRRAIAPKGVFAFDIYQPNLDYLRTPQTIASPGP